MSHATQFAHDTRGNYVLSSNYSRSLRITPATRTGYQKTWQFQRPLRIEAPIDNAGDYRIDRRTDPRVSSSTNRKQGLLIVAGAMENKCRRNRRTVASVRKPSTVAGRITTIRSQLVVVWKTNPWRDVKISTPGAKGLSYRYEIPLTICDRERCRTRITTAFIGILASQVVLEPN